MHYKFIYQQLGKKPKGVKMKRELIAKIMKAKAHNGSTPKCCAVF